MLYTMQYRSLADLHPLCHAQWSDYLLLALYGCLLLFIAVQLAVIGHTWCIARDSKEKNKIRNLLLQHMLLLFTCVLQILYLCLKPILSIPALLAIALLPMVLQLTVLMFLITTWMAVGMLPLVSKVVRLEVGMGSKSMKIDHSFIVYFFSNEIPVAALLSGSEYPWWCFFSSCRVWS